MRTFQQNSKGGYAEMKIGEILELSQTKRMSDIAKEHLNIGEKPAREALKNAGCYSISGKKGWHFDGSPEVLEKSIYEFATVKGRAKANATTYNHSNLNTNNHSNETSKKEVKESNIERNNGSINKQERNKTKELNNNSASEQNNEVRETMKQDMDKTTEVERKRASFDLRPALIKQLKIKAVTEDRNLYELVEEAIEEYLNK